MLNITTHDSQKTTHFVDEFFNENMTSSEFTDADIMFLREIDNAEVIGNNEIRTPMGVCDIKNLSTGVKTLICIMHFKDIVFNISGCGSNVIDLLFEEASNLKENITVYINFIPAFNNWYDSITLNNDIIYNKQEFRRWWSNYEAVGV